MTTGFMAHSISVFLLLCAAAGPAAAANVALVGTIGDKAAIVSVDGGAPKAVRVGQKWQEISVVAVEQDRATLEIAGKRRVLQRGELFGAAAPGGKQTAKLSADDRGHYFAEGAVNGATIRFVVDTGATVVALPAAEADRIGLDYRSAPRGMTQTANGPVSVFQVRLDTVRVGSIELSGVDAIVIERGLPVPLLGMSFLNRTDMTREGQTMTLVRRF